MGSTKGGMAMRGIKQQAGMTLIGWLLTMIVVGFTALIAMRLVPVYQEGFAVRTIMHRLEQERELPLDNRAEIMNTLIKHLDSSYVERVKRENISFEKVVGGLQVTVEYDARVTLIGNLDAVAHFREQAIIRP